MGAGCHFVSGMHSSLVGVPVPKKLMYYNAMVIRGADYSVELWFSQSIRSGYRTNHVLRVGWEKIGFRCKR